LEKPPSEYIKGFYYGTQPIEEAEFIIYCSVSLFHKTKSKKVNITMTHFNEHGNNTMLLSRFAVLTNIDPNTLREAAYMDGELYAQSQVAFRSNTDQQERMLDWTCSQRAILFPEKEALSLLSVGCGEGLFELSLLKRLSGWNPHVHFTGIDPNREVCRRFLSKESQLGALPAGYFVDVQPVRFERYHPDSHFDLVSFVHRLYFFTDVEAVLRKALAMTRGHLLLFHTPCEALNVPFAFLWSHCWERKLIFSAELASILEQLDVSFVRHNIPASLNITDCFHPLEAITHPILSFILQSDAAKLPPTVLKSILMHLWDASVPGERETRWIAHPVTAFIVKATEQLPDISARRSPTFTKSQTSLLTDPILW